ncbi:hypothetical protein NDA13_005317 [Ustilago tritici]|nr:hypothetical protein NDA13_005317 [Ustilago tritici]
MFLPRHTSFQADQRLAMARRGSSASSIGLQVHETILAAKARDMSSECGLGLADEGTEAELHDVSELDSQVENVEATTRSKQSIDHLFIANRPTPETDHLTNTAHCDGRRPKRHSTKRASLRGYAEARWTRHESLRDRVMKANNVAKLEWEAKAALLHHSYPLAILLLFRAASLGSANACEQLASLYAYGVTRGVSPVVTLIYRDALRSLAWTLEALRLYERRLAAQFRAAHSSSMPSLRLTQIWQGPLEASQLLVRGLLSSDVGAFDPHQRNAVFLPVVDDLSESQCTWALRGGSSHTQSARQAPELWMELDDVVQRWTARLEAERATTLLPSQEGPDEVEEQQQLLTTMQSLSFHLLVLRAIQLTRSLTLEPYAENVKPAQLAWSKAAAVKPHRLVQCPEPTHMIRVLARASDTSDRIYDEQLFSDLSSCAQECLDVSVATDYKRRKIQASDSTHNPASRVADKTQSPRAKTQSRDRLRDLAPADVETSKQMEANARPALTMRVSRSFAPPQAAVASVSASGEHQTALSSGASASNTVRQKYGRAVSSSSMALVSGITGIGSAEPSSPTDSVRTGFSLGVGRPRRPSSVVSVTPSLLFPPESRQDGQHTTDLDSDDYFSAPSSLRTRATSSSQSARGELGQRPRVASMYSSTPALVTSTSSISLLAPSMLTTSQQSLNALAAANPTHIPVPSRRRTGSNASLGSLNPRVSSILPKTSPSILEMPEASIGATSISASGVASHAETSKRQSAAADTLRRLKGRRSQTDLRALHSARKDQNVAPPVPSVPANLTNLPSSAAASRSPLQPSKSTIFVSVENLPEDTISEARQTAAKATRGKAASAGSAMEHLAKTQARMSHQTIPSVLEEAETITSAAHTETNGPSFTSALAAGALSGLTVDLLFFPIDTIKTRLQSAQGFLAAGGFTGVYRGLASTAVGSAPGAAVFFTTYESMKPALVRWMPSVFGSEGSLGPAGVHMTSASIAEVAACLIRVPTEVIKSRQQTMTYGKGTTTFQAFKKVFQEAGIRGYYRGFGSTVGREVPFTCIQFPLYERLKLEMARSRANSQSASASALEKGDRKRSISDQELVRNLPTWQAGLAGSIAGAIAAGLTTPLDVVKTRIMLHTKQSAPSPSATIYVAATAAETLPRGVNTDIIPTLLHIGRTEGVKTLFSGFLPRTMWIGLGGAVFLGTFDAGIKTLS